MSTPISAATLLARFDSLVRLPIVSNPAYQPNFFSTFMGSPTPVPPVATHPGSNGARPFLPPPAVAPNPPGTWTFNHEPMSGGNEPVGFPPAIQVGTWITEEMFYLLHNMAMRLCRVRVVRVFYTLGTSVVTELPGTYRAALPGEQALYFDMPPLPATIGPGVIIEGEEVGPPNDLDNFLIALRNRVINIRTNPAFAHAHIFSCHSNCHGACHGSRSRR